VKEHLYFSPSAVGGPILRKTGAPAMTHWAVALTPDGQCVFGERRNLKPSDLPKGYTVYTPEVEKQRRLVCDSALGQLVLDNPGMVYRAMKVVNDGIRRFVADVHQKEVMAATRVYEDRATKETKSMPLGQYSVEVDGKYVTSTTSFGKHDPLTWGVDANRWKDRWVPFRATMNRWLAAFNEPDLPRQIGLHDVFLKVYCSGMTATFGAKAHTPQQLANEYGLREDWYDQAPRGRMNNPAFDAKTGGSEEPGLIGPGVTIPWKGSFERAGVVEATRRKEKRNRGVDMFQMDVAKILPEYHRELRKYNLGFSAAVSGTTSTLLASAYTFATPIRSDSELKKQYLLACVGYLVGSGMHTCHEVFYTGSRAGLPYKTGKYLDMLPRSFVDSEVGKKWQAEFWDLVRPDRRTTQ
jgi:hypothetical protein